VSEVKINRIKRENAHLFNLLEDALTDGTLLIRSKDMRHKLAVVKERQEMLHTADVLTHAASQGGKFDPTKQFHLVANNVDPAVWRIILDTFARVDPDTGEYMDDGLLYTTQPDEGTGELKVKLNRDFFYALLSGPLKDYNCQGLIGR
jgi:hypothetical protein